MYCEHCGLQILPQRPVCTRCGKTPTHQLFQLTSLVVLFLSVLCNSVVAWFVLPRLVENRPSLNLFRIWTWANHEAVLYGWIPLAAALLFWDFMVWRKIKRAKPMPKLKGWVSRKLLAFTLAAGFAPILPWWVPAGQPSDKFLAGLAHYPGLPCAFSWGVLLFVCALLCAKAETRDLILGKGRILSAISLGALGVVLSLTVVGWALT